MTKHNSTKRAFVASALALLLCVAMLAGSTLAWFSDSVTVSGNKIKAGTFDIELWQTTYKDWMDQPGEEGFVEKNITDSTEPIFLSELWEPGFLAYTNLTVKNVGTLAAKINATLVPVGEVGKLAEVIDVYVATVPFADMYDSYTIRQFFNGEYVLPWGGGMNMFDSYVVKVGTLAEVMANGTNLAEYKGMDAVINAGDEYQVNIALKVQESAGNEYQAAEAGIFDIRIVATQATVEEDDFDDQYDADATYPVFVEGQEDFTAALEAAKEGDTICVGDGVYAMNGANSINDIKGLNIIGTGNTVIDSVNGFTDCTFTNVTVNDIYTLNGNQFVGCEIVAPVNDVACATQLNGNTTFSNCSFTANGSGTSFWADAVQPNTAIVFENCTFIDNIRLGGNETNYYTFKNCEFKGGKVNWSKALVITYAPATFDTCTFTIEGDAQYGVRLAVGMTAEAITLVNTTTPIMVP